MNEEQQKSCPTEKQKQSTEKTGMIIVHLYIDDKSRIMCMQFTQYGLKIRHEFFMLWVVNNA